MARRFGSRHTIQRIRRTLAELEYAQRRLFEIQTGLRPAGPLQHTADRAAIAELEAQWRL
ncbi:MAG: hypothetical protein ACJ780_18280 [Solirubrobacteraceae bacterium]